MNVKYITNYYTFWVYIWFILFQNNIINYSPFHLFVLFLLHDIYMIAKNYKNMELNKLSVLRWSYIIMMHYIPLIVLSPEISFKSIKFNILLMLLYLATFKLKSYTPYDSYLQHGFDENTSLDNYFKLRFGNMNFGVFFWLFCLYSSVSYLSN